MLFVLALVELLIFALLLAELVFAFVECLMVVGFMWLVLRLSVLVSASPTSLLMMLFAELNL
jgi:hypothetical protein